MEKITEGRQSPPESESVLEELFWRYVRYTRDGLANCTSQLEIGAYRVDAIFDCGDSVVVVELDGKEYHDWERDAARDSVLLNEVGTIIRIPYRALKLTPFATFKILSLWYPRFELERDSRTMSQEELQSLYDREISELPDDEKSDWFCQFNDVIEVWSHSGSNTGLVGSPRGFLKQGHMSAITRRNGKTSPELLARLRTEIARRNK